jgi:hypothetical protein
MENTRYLILFYLLVILTNCNNNSSFDQLKKIQKKSEIENCKRSAIQYRRLMKNDNLLFNIWENHSIYFYGAKGILEDDYGIFVFTGSDICNCDSLNKEINSHLYSKIDTTLIKESLLKYDTKEMHHHLLAYSRELIPLSYTISPLFRGSKDKYDSLHNLENIQCKKQYSNDSFLVSFKLWLDTNGNITKTKQLLKYNKYWDSIAINHLKDNFHFNSAYKLNNLNELYKVPSIIYVDLYRRWW